MRERRLGVALIAVILLALASQHHSINISISAEADDAPASSPRVQIAADERALAVSLLWSWDGLPLLGAW
jgi:hypothetical protein